MFKFRAIRGLTYKSPPSDFFRTFEGWGDLEIISQDRMVSYFLRGVTSKKLKIHLILQFFAGGGRRLKKSENAPKFLTIFYAGGGDDVSKIPKIPLNFKQFFTRGEMISQKMLEIALNLNMFYNVCRDEFEKHESCPKIPSR